jgi:hypothetical protein
LGVLLTDELEERIEVRRRTVGPPGEPHRDGRRVADGPVDHPGTAVPGGRRFEGDADGLPPAMTVSQSSMPRTGRAALGPPAEDHSSSLVVPVRESTATVRPVKSFRLMLRRAG